MTDKHAERRKTQRRRLCVPVVCWPTERDRQVSRGTEFMTRDLSAEGLSFESDVLYPMDKTFTAEVYVPGRRATVVTKLKVVSIESIMERSRYLIGLSFEEISAEDRNFIALSLESMNLYAMLDEAIEKGASDLHLTVGRPPVLRISQKIHPIGGYPPLGDGQIRAMIYPLLGRDQVEYFEKHKDLDFAFSPNVHSRFRVNLHSQKGFVEAAFRSVSAHVKKIKELGLPVKAVENFCVQKAGLVLIAGKTGAGKTTTAAAMVDFINHHFERVVVTVEDPIEYLHESKKSIVKQRELGSDTASYGEALRHALRQDPDVIVVGELLDATAVLAAIRAAETGHLVITTIHAPETVQAIERLINLFPPEHSTHVAQQLSSTLVGVLFQVLVPAKPSGLVPATEVLVSTPAIANMIREKAFSQIRTGIQTGVSHGMHTLQSDLRRLFESGAIELRTLQDFEK